jgi:hypothetical protein
MSGDFDILAASAADDLEETFGVDVVYTDSAGTEKTVHAMFADQAGVRSDVQDGQQDVQRAVGLVKVADVALPAPGDLIEFRGRFWSVDAWNPAMGGSRWELHLVLATDLEKSRENFRLRRR